jgi:hypothetical protein
MGSSAGARVGRTACQASVWSSSSGVVCKAPGGVMGGAVGIVSVYMLLSRFSAMFSWNSPIVDSFIVSGYVSNFSVPSSGSSHVFLHGLGFVSNDITTRFRFLSSAAPSSNWASESHLTLKSPGGFGQMSHVVFSMNDASVKSVVSTFQSFDDVEPVCTPSFTDIREVHDNSIYVIASCLGKADNMTLIVSKSNAIIHTQTIRASCFLNNLYIKNCTTPFSIADFILQNESSYEMSVFASAASSTSSVSNVSREFFDYLPDLKFGNLFNQIEFDYLPFQRNLTVFNLQDYHISSEMKVNGISINLQQGLFSFSNGSCQISINLPDLSLYNISTVSGASGVFRLTRFFKTIQFSFAIRPPFRPKLFSISPSIIPFHGSQVRLKLISVSEPIFNFSTYFSHSTELLTATFWEESDFAAFLTINIPGIPSANMTSPMLLRVSCVLNNNIKSLFHFSVQMNSFRLLSVSPSIFQASKITPVLVTFITEMLAAPLSVTCSFTDNNSSLNLALVSLGSSATIVPSLSSILSFTVQFIFSSNGQRMLTFTAFNPSSNSSIETLIDTTPYPSASLDVSVIRIISGRKNNFKIKAFFLKNSKNSLDIVTSISVFQSNSSVQFECLTVILSDDLSILSCVIELPSQASFLNISVENKFSNRTARVSLEVMLPSALRLLAIYPSSLSIMGSQLVFASFVNLPKDTSNTSFRIYFSGENISNELFVPDEDIFLYGLNSTIGLENSLSVKFGRHASMRSFLPLLIESIGLEDQNLCSLLIFRVPTALNCSNCFQKSARAVLNVSVLSNFERNIYVTPVSFIGFQLHPILEPFISLPAIETDVPYTLSFLAKNFPPIRDPIDLDIDVIDEFNNALLPEFSILSDDASDHVLLSIRLFFNKFGTKTIRIRARVFGPIDLVSPTANFSFLVKPFFRIKLIQQSSDFVYLTGGPRSINMTLKDAQESDMIDCNVFIMLKNQQVNVSFRYNCFPIENQCSIAAVIPSLGSDMSTVTITLLFPSGETKAILAVLAYPSSPIVLQSKNTLGIMSSGNNPDVIVEFTNFPAIVNLSDVVILMEGSTFPVRPTSIRSSFLSTQVSFSAPFTTFDQRIMHKVINFFVFELGSLCNRSCSGIVVLNYTNSLAAHLQYQSGSSCIAKVQCNIDIYVTNLISQSFDAFYIISNSNTEHKLRDSKNFLMGPGMSSMSVIKTSLLRNITGTSSFSVQAGLQQINFSISFDDANAPYCSQLYPSIVSSYGGSSMTIHLQNAFSAISEGQCRLLWTSLLTSNCQIEKLVANGSYSLSTIVPVLSIASSAYSLVLDIHNYGTINCGSVQSFLPDTTISISPSVAFSTGGQFVVAFQNFPLATTISSIIPIAVESSSFFDVVLFERSVQSDLQSGQMILSFSGLNPGRQMLKISHASVAFCVATATFDIVDQTQPRILKTSPSTGDTSKPSLFELQVMGPLPSLQIISRGILFATSGRIFVMPWIVLSVSPSDSTYTVIVRSLELPESGKCTIQLYLANGVVINSSNLTFFNPKSLVIQSVRQC